jgi:putative ABC transport system substrate-binding protein
MRFPHFRSANPKSKTRSERRRAIQPKLARVLALIIALVALAGVAPAQQPKKVFRIGYLGNGNATSEATRVDGIQQALHKQGFIEGQNIAIEYRYAEGKPDRLPELAVELVRLKVDVILATGGPSIQAAVNATKTIPIILTGQGSDPVEAGLIKSLARPGANVTGITNITSELGGKRLELLKEAVPKLTRIAVLFDPTIPANALQVKEYLPPAAHALKLTIRSWELRAADEFEKVFAAIGKQRPDGVYVTGGFLMLANHKRISGWALKSHLPSMYWSSIAVESGGLMSYGADLKDSYRQVAWYIDKILKGAKAADLPVQQPMKFDFVINLQTAKRIGVTIPPDLLARATKIIR